MKKLIFIFITLFTVAFTLNANKQESDPDVLLAVEENVTEIMNESFEDWEEHFKRFITNNSNVPERKRDLKNNYLLVPIVAIVGSFLFPLGIIFIVFYSKYKEKKARYLLAEKALAAGKDIPEGLFGASAYNREAGTFAKGIKNMCLGIALAIFLWAIIDEFWAACIGLIIFFNGLGQLLIYKLKPADAFQEKSNRKDRGKNNEEDIKDIPYFDIDTDNNANEKR